MLFVTSMKPLLSMLIPQSIKQHKHKKSYYQQFH